ncbi:MAG: 50S ribosomal protein L25 [Chloroflexi bacterium]|nr:50S ribosomal protein L25 [Chloroflexota bacterium]
MADRPQIPAQPRTVSGKNVSRLRREGLLPAVVYGQSRPSESIQIDAREFETLRRSVSRNSLVELRIGDARPQPVMLHEFQEHPVNRRVLHVDFLVVNMAEELTVDVPINYSGTSEAVDRMGGTLLHPMDTVQVRALPTDLPQSLNADISALDSFDAVITAGELSLPERVTLVTEAHEVVARVQQPRLEEEPVAGEEVAEGTEPVEAGADAGEDGAAGDTSES